MKKYRISKVFISLLLLVIANPVLSQNSEIYGPFLQSNPERIDSQFGYCKNAVEEKKLWTEINKFSKSFLSIVPSIPPEQKKYIQEELKSSNPGRAGRVSSGSFYKMDRVYQAILNVEGLSSIYLRYHGELVFQKKIEIIGRVLLNIKDDPIIFGEIPKVAADLRGKDFYIKDEDLFQQWAVLGGIRAVLAMHLICYGEKLD